MLDTTFKPTTGAILNTIMSEVLEIYGDESVEDWNTYQPEYLAVLALTEVKRLKAALDSKQGTEEIRQHALQAIADLGRIAFLYGEL